MADTGDSSWIIDLIEGGGYLTVALLMFAETVFPPIPSEVVMPLVGFLAAEGRLSLPGGIAAGTAGSVGGAYAWFVVARRVGAERLKRWAGRHGRWLTVSPDDIDRVLHWFQRHGATAVLVGRLVPAVRTLVSVPAGIARMPTRTFLLWTTVGTLAWSGTLAIIGFLLGDRYEAIAGSVGVFANVVIGSAVLLYVYRVVTFRR
jgi:membrane protein DedA with SNARE-associated domain